MRDRGLVRQRLCEREAVRDRGCERQRLCEREACSTEAVRDRGLQVTTSLDSLANMFSAAAEPEDHEASFDWSDSHQI